MEDDNGRRCYIIWIPWHYIQMMMENVIRVGEVVQPFLRVLRDANGNDFVLPLDTEVVGSTHEGLDPCAAIKIRHPSFPLTPKEDRFPDLFCREFEILRITLVDKERTPAGR